MSSQTLAGEKTDSTENSFTHRICEIPSKGWEKAWVWCGERINPIVVKEIRQSLKSRQFTISFGLTLIAAISWTILSVAVMVPRIYFMPAGLPLLVGFFCILTLPLMVIIPFGAFRSLAAETDDSTFELLSISALSSTQIVYGKMASAGVQILLYLSALAPCIVLTYLLRGVGLFTILFLLSVTVVFSLAETAIALLLAAVAGSRLLQNLSSVIALAGLLLGFFAWTTSLIAMFANGGDELANPPREIYIVIFASGTLIAWAIALVLRAAAAAIDFQSENSSTPLRLRIIGLVGLALFWSILGIVASEDHTPTTLLCFAIAVPLSVFGALMTGERGVISPRAQRSLPKTFFGRVFLTWLYPGAGMGYVFTIGLFGAVFVTLAGVEVFYDYRSSFGKLSTSICGFLCLCYMAIYLGINRLVLMLVPRHVPGRMLAAIALLAVVLILAHLLPLFIVYYLNDYRSFDYDWHQAFNIPWTLSEALDSRTFDLGASTAVVTLCAVAIFGLNLILCTRDVMLVRIAEPPRVREDEEKEQPPRQPDAIDIDPFADE